MATATMESVQKNVRALPDVYDSMAESMTSYAINTNQTWPYVTSPDWNRMGAHVRALTSTVACLFGIIVTDPMGWAAYSAKMASPSASPIIYQVVNDSIVPVFMPGLYAVTWQTDAEWAQIGAGQDAFINYDLYADPLYAGLAKLSAKLRMGIVSPFASTREISSENIDAIKAMMPDGMTFDPDNMNDVLEAAFPPWDPQSSFTVTVYENFEPDSKPVGLVMGYMRWSKYFSTSLLKDGLGIYCVVGNSNGEMQTWVVQKSGVKYLGVVSQLMM
jgi:hypothetical protein